MKKIDVKLLVRDRFTALPPQMVLELALVIAGLGFTVTVTFAHEVIMLLHGLVPTRRTK